MAYQVTITMMCQRTYRVEGDSVDEIADEVQELMDLANDDPGEFAGGCNVIDVGRTNVRFLGAS